MNPRRLVTYIVKVALDEVGVSALAMPLYDNDIWPEGASGVWMVITDGKHKSASVDFTDDGSTVAARVVAENITKLLRPSRLPDFEPEDVGLDDYKLDITISFELSDEERMRLAARPMQTRPDYLKGPARRFKVKRSVGGKRFWDL